MDWLRKQGAISHTEMAPHRFWRRSRLRTSAVPAAARPLDRADLLYGSISQFAFRIFATQLCDAPALMGDGIPNTLSTITLTCSREDLRRGGAEIPYLRGLACSWHVGG